MARSDPDYLIICSAPRTGSTLLGTLLQSAGLASEGVEFFGTFGVMPRDVLPQIGLSSVEDVRKDLPRYLRLIAEHWSRPGRPMSIKIHWRQLVYWRDFGLDLATSFPRARFVLCTRENKVAQAISMTRALQTSAWISQHAPRGDPQYDFRRLLAELAHLVKDTAGWEAYFRETGIEPFRVVYEDLDRDPKDVVVRLARWLGLRVSPLRRRRIQSELQKQRDALNEEWERRFYMDLHQLYEATAPPSTPPPDPPAR